MGERRRTELAGQKALLAMFQKGAHPLSISRRAMVRCGYRDEFEAALAAKLIEPASISLKGQRMSNPYQCSRKGFAFLESTHD